MSGNLSDYVTGASPMSGSQQLSDFEGRLLEILTFKAYPGGNGMGEYCIMQVIDVATGDEAKTRSSSIGVVDKMRKALEAGAELPLNATPVWKRSAANRKYLDLE